MLAVHLKNELDHFEHTDSHLLGITTGNASSNYSMTHNLQLTLQASEIEWPVLRNHIPCMVHAIQLASGSFMSSLGVNGRTKSWTANERDQQSHQQNVNRSGSNMPISQTL